MSLHNKRVWASPYGWMSQISKDYHNMDLSLRSRVQAINGMRISYLDELLFYRYADGSVHIRVGIQYHMRSKKKSRSDNNTDRNLQQNIVYPLFYYRMYLRFNG